MAKFAVCDKCGNTIDGTPNTLKDMFTGHDSDFCKRCFDLIKIFMVTKPEEPNGENI